MYYDNYSNPGYPLYNQTPAVSYSMYRDPMQFQPRYGYSNPNPSPVVPPTAGYMQPGGGAAALPQGGAGAPVPPTAYGFGGNVPGATPLGAQGPSFAGPGLPANVYGAGANPLGTQGPSPAGDVYQQIAGINQRLNQMSMSVGQPGAPGDMTGHDFLASVISPMPEMPNNYLGGYGDGKLIPTVGTNNTGR